MFLFNGNKKYFSLHKIDLKVAKVIYVNFAGYGNLDHIFGRWFSNLGRNLDRDHKREHDGFRGFVGCSDLFDDYSLIITSLCELIDLIRYYLDFY